MTEHDAERPWVVRSREHRTVQLREDASFFEWAAQHYPRDRFTIELDPWALSPDDWR